MLALDGAVREHKRLGTRYRKSRIGVATIDRLQDGDTVMDIEEPGFGVRRQGTARVFFLRKYARGRRHFITIGEYGTGDLTVTRARELAKKAVVAIREGFSPSERRSVDRSMPTVQAFASDWLKLHVDAKLKPATARLYRSTLASTILPAIGRVRVDQLTIDNVTRMHHSARHVPYAANRALAITSKLMNHAERVGLRPGNSNPVKGMERYREQRRERFLSRDELGRLGNALANPNIISRHSPFALGAIGLLLLTGMRLNEALKLRWNEVDLQRGLLLLSDSKSGKKAIIIGQHAASLLESFPRTDIEWVFPGSKHGKPLHDVKKVWRSVTALAGLDGVRIHDLRHTFASYSAGAGASLPMIGKLLGHSQAATTARYAHLAQDPVREIANRTCETVAALLGKNTPHV
jgi:integrase